MAGRLFGTASAGNAQAPEAAGFRVQTSIYGLPIPIVYGTARVAGNLIHLQDPKQTAIKSQAQSSKLVKVDSQVTGYSYSAAIVLALAEGPIAGIGKVWRDKDAAVAWSAYQAAGWSLFLGAAAQSPWAYLTSGHPGEAVPYQFTAYVAHPSLDLPGNSLSNYGWEIGGLAIYGSLGIVDANPRDVLVDLLTNVDHGAQIPSSRIADLTQFSNYCIAMGLFLSPVLNGQDALATTIASLLEASNAGIVWYDGVLNVIPYGDSNVTGNGVTFIANTTPVYDLTDDDFLDTPGEDPVQVERKRAAEAFNQFTVEFENRARDYAPDVQEAKDQASIEANTLRPASPLRYPAIKDAATARLVAQLRLQRELNIRNVYRFKLPSRFALLTPMDLVTITDIGLGFSKLPVRLVSIDELDDGGLDVVAEDWPLGTATASRYGAASSGGYASATNAAPGAIASAVAFEAPGALTSAAMEIWVGAKGAGAAWGGCEIHISADNVRFTKVGSLLGRTNFGTLRSALAAAGATLQVDLSAGGGGVVTASSAAGLAALESLCFVDGEFVAYQGAALVGASQFDLTTLARGLYGSTVPASHLTGSTFVRCDSALARIAWPNGKDGDVVYFKFPSFNTYGGALEDIAGVTSYAHTIGRTFVTSSGAVAPQLSLTQQIADADSTSTTVHASIGTGTTPASGLTYTITRKNGAGAPTVMSSGSATALPLDLFVRLNPRLTAVFTLTVTDPLFATPFVEVLTVGADGRDGARGTGTAVVRTTEDDGRSGQGGISTPRGRIFTDPIYDASGAIPLVDTIGRQLHGTMQYPNGLDDVTEPGTYKRTNANQRDGGGRGFNAIDVGNSIVAGSIDFARGFINKHLGSVADDATSDRRAASANEKTGGSRGFSVIDSGFSIVASGIDLARGFVNKHLGSIPDDVTSDRRAATLNQKTGGDRGLAAIDVGGVLVAGAADFSRAYTGKHLGNMPDDATSDRRAATATEKVGGARGAVGLDASSKLQTGVTSAATAADGVAGIESGKGAGTKAARNAGTATVRVADDDKRGGLGGIPTAGAQYSGMPLYDVTGAVPLVDPTSKQVGAGLVVGTGARSVSDATTIDQPIQKLQNDGNAASTMTQTDGTQARIMSKGYQWGTVKHGNPIVFSPAFSATPSVVLSPANGTVFYQPDSAKWSAGFSSAAAQLPDYYVAGLGPTGGTAHLQLRQKGGTTEEDREFTTGNSLTAGGQAVQTTAALAHASASAHYTVRYTYSVSANLSAITPGAQRTAQIVVQINRRAGGVGGAATELARTTYTVTDPLGAGGTTNSGTAAIDVVSAALAVGDYLEVKLLSFTASGNAGTQSCVVHGVNPTDDGAGNHGVVLFFGSADATASMTPDTGDVMKWEAWGIQ